MNTEVLTWGLIWMSVNFSTFSSFLFNSEEESRSQPTTCHSSFQRQNPPHAGTTWIYPFWKWLRPCLNLVLTCILCDHTAIGSCWTAWKSRNKQPWHKKGRWWSSRADHIWKCFNTQCIQMFVRCMHWTCQATFQLQICQGSRHSLFML